MMRRCVPPSCDVCVKGNECTSNRYTGYPECGFLGGRKWTAYSVSSRKWEPYPRARGWNGGDLEGRAFWIFPGFGICWLRWKAEHVEAS